MNIWGNLRGQPMERSYPGRATFWITVTPMSPAGPETRNDCAGEGQQQFARQANEHRIVKDVERRGHDLFKSTIRGFATEKPQSV
jgi:hypothetical protein